MKNEMKIAILFGGHSSEYEVSLQSAYAVIRGLHHERYEKILIGITRQGEWFRYNGDIEYIADDTWYSKGSCVKAMFSPDRNARCLIEFHENRVQKTTVDAIFPVLHGKNGEDGTVQGLAELAAIPVIGCGTLSSALCMDKDMAHRIVSSIGVRVPESIVIQKSFQIEELSARLEKLKYPLFVKPVKAGSSIGITKVEDRANLYEAICKAFKYDDKVVAEENIEGFEVGCAVMGNDELIIGEVDEIELAEGFFDFTEKYTLKTSKILMPARIDTDTAGRVKDTAAKIYRTLGCRGFARVDMFLTPQGEIVFNEVNTIPGFTSHSRYPNMMKGIGLSFESLLDQLVRLAVEA